MKLPRLRLTKPSAPVPPPDDPNPSFYEYHLDGPGCRPRHTGSETTLFVVLDRESRFIYSEIRIVFYFKQSPSMQYVGPETWNIQLHGSVTHTPRDHLPDPPPNDPDPSLPTLTIAFELVRYPPLIPPITARMVLRSPTPDDLTNLHHQDHNDTDILFDYRSHITPNTSSLSFSFTHTIALDTSFPGYDDPWYLRDSLDITDGYFFKRVVRVLPPRTSVITSDCKSESITPRPRSRQRQRTRPRALTTASTLPTELLLKIFEDYHFSQQDLITLARVSSTWGHCALQILRSHWNSRYHLNPYLLAHLLTDVPSLGLGLKELHFIDLMGMLPTSDTVISFTIAAITILSRTKNLAYLQLALFDPSRFGALVKALGGLRNLRTLILGRSWRYDEGGKGWWNDPLGYGYSDSWEMFRMITVDHVVRIMHVLPSLRSLHVHHVQSAPPTSGLAPRLQNLRFTLRPGLTLTLRPPQCRLTHLTLSQSTISDTDLTQLFAHSTRTLEVVVLDRLYGVTNDGLRAFLGGIKNTVCALTVRDVGVGVVLSTRERERERERQYERERESEARGSGIGGKRNVKAKEGEGERALDVMVARMPRLRELRIDGDVASELMIQRRSEVYLRSREQGEGTTEMKSRGEMTSVTEMRTEMERGVPVLKLWVGECRALTVSSVSEGVDGRPGWSIMMASAE